MIHQLDRPFRLFITTLISEYSIKSKTTGKRPIALFIPALNGGGAQRVVVNLANTFVDLVDRPVHVVLARREGPFLHDLRDEIEVVDLKAGRALFSIKKLAKYLICHRPLVIMSSLNYANIVCILAHSLARRPCRLVVREATVVVSTRMAESFSIHRWSLKVLMRLFYPLSDAVIANSPDTLTSLLDAGIPIADKAVVIGNPVAFTDPFSNQSYQKHYLSLPQDEHFFCAMGRLVPLKGFDTLISAFARIKASHMNLVVLGEGPDREALENHAKELDLADRVYFPGFIDHPQDILSRASGFVLSSRWEGFGNVIVEALALGIPVVSTDCPGGPRMILENGKYGFLTPVNDPISLAKALDKVLIDPPSDPIGRRERAKVFSCENISSKYLDILLPAIDMSVGSNDRLGWGHSQRET